MAKENKPPSWIPAPAKLILNKELSGNDKTLYLYLLWRQGRNKTAWPSQETMATDMAVSLCTVQRAIKNLEGKNLIEVKKTDTAGRGHYHHYKVKNLMQQDPQGPSEAWLKDY